MQSKTMCGKMITRDGYLLCPICQRQKVLRLLPGTKGEQLAVYCKTCRKEPTVNVSTLSLSQRAGADSSRRGVTVQAVVFCPEVIARGTKAASSVRTYRLPRADAGGILPEAQAKGCLPPKRSGGRLAQVVRAADIPRPLTTGAAPAGAVLPSVRSPWCARVCHRCRSRCPAPRRVGTVR